MFDNPLYGSMVKSQVRNRDLDNSHWEPPTVLEPAIEPDRPPVPTPRNRSFTCSDSKPQPPTPIATHHSANKKPVVPSRSEGAMQHGRPPLPTKSRPGMAEPQASKPRDYRDNLELPVKRLPARPGQSSPHRDGKESMTWSLGFIFISFCSLYIWLSLCRSAWSSQKKHSLKACLQWLLALTRIFYL